MNVEASSSTEPEATVKSADADDAVSPFSRMAVDDPSWMVSLSSGCQNTFDPSERVVLVSAMPALKTDGGSSPAGLSSVRNTDVQEKSPKARGSTVTNNNLLSILILK